MIRHILSRYSLRYPRTLVYMLQASEYNVREYLGWYHQLHDFSHVEKRKAFVHTAKGVALLTIAWTGVIAYIGALVAVVVVYGSPLSYLAGIIGVILTPFVLAYGILIPLFLITLVQLPIEYVVVRSARVRLEKHPAMKIGIAGSFGKTTMREVLKTVLTEGTHVVAPPHSYNTPLGISRFVQTLTGDEDVIIFELGEYYPGDVRKLCALVQPDMGIITGVNEAHLQKFKTLEKTTQTIFELADYLGEKAVYVNGESVHAKNNVSPHHLVYTREGIGDWRVENPTTDLTGVSFTLVMGDESMALTSSLLGLHQVGPLVASVHIARALGLTSEQIVRGVKNTKPFDHRLEVKKDATGVVTLDDSYNGNPDGVEAVIAFLASLEGHRRFYVTPGLVEMGEKTKEVHRQIGKQLAQAGIEKVVLIRNSVTSYIEEGLKEVQYTGETLWFDDALAAFAALPQMTVEGDVVLLQNDWPDQYQ